MQLVDYGKLCDSILNLDDKIRFVGVYLESRYYKKMQQDITSYLSEEETEESLKQAQHYSLGFAPREKGQSGLHLLRLKGKSRSWRLRYRQSYVTKTPRIRLADRAVGTLTVHWVDNPHEIDLRVASEFQADDGNYDVTVMLTLPISALSCVFRTAARSTRATHAATALPPATA